MCEICLQTPCHPRCPHADEPPLYAECEACGAEIYDGDEYYEVGERNYCEACVKGGYKTAEID